MRLPHKLILIFIILLPSSCAEPLPTRNPAFDQYVSSFIQYGKQFGYDTQNWDKISITFDAGMEGEGAIGLCNYYDNLEAPDRGIRNHIQILPDWWENVGDLDRESVVFHELGHCLLNREHEEKTVDGIPASLMYPYEIYKMYYERYHDQYIYELFFPGWRFLWGLEQ